MLYLNQKRSLKAWALIPTLVLYYFFAGAAGVAGAVTAGLAAGAETALGFIA
jgi:hypothetical protein